MAWAAPAQDCGSVGNERLLGSVVPRSLRAVFFLRAKRFFFFPRKGWSRGRWVRCAALRAARSRVRVGGVGRLAWRRGRCRALTAGHACRALCCPVLPSPPGGWGPQAQHAQPSGMCLVEVLGHAACALISFSFGFPPCSLSFRKRRRRRSAVEAVGPPRSPGPANAGGGSPSRRKGVAGPPTVPAGRREGEGSAPDPEAKASG